MHQITGGGVTMATGPWTTHLTVEKKCCANGLLFDKTAFVVGLGDQESVGTINIDERDFSLSQDKGLVVPKYKSFSCRNDGNSALSVFILTVDDEKKTGVKDMKGLIKFLQMKITVNDLVRVEKVQT